jgi:hypothetical protein
VEPTIICYPAIPGLTTSQDVAAEVNGRSVWVEKYVSNFGDAVLPTWFTDQPHTHGTQQVNLVNFACGGPVRVKLTASEPIESFAIHPKSRRIEGVREGKTLTFSLPGPDKLYIEINGLPPICFFANPIEESAPRPDEANVIYFGPGVHRPGAIALKDGAVVYIAPGAIVYGSLRGSPKRARVFGGGILDGQYVERLVRLQDASDVEVSGVMLRNGRGWQNTLTNCRGVTYRNVKVISFGNSGDGIDPVGSRDVTIDDCFFRCTDDCVAVKSLRVGQSVENVQIVNCTMVGFACADAITIGFETNGPTLKNIVARNCDVVLSRGGNAVGRHSAFSVICDGPGWVTDVRFEDIRVEENVDRLFELHVTDGTAYVKGLPGHIKGVRLKDIAWAAEKPIFLVGLDANHMVEDVVFENCTVAGKPLQRADPKLFTINEFVRNVGFEEKRAAAGTAKIIRDGERVYIDGFQKAAFHDKNSVLATISGAMAAIGEPASYEYLMGVSGQAFRTQFMYTNGCPSSACAPCGYNTMNVALEALGYDVTWYLPENNPAVQEQARRAVVAAVDRGRPALLASEETGLLVGYAKGGQELLCREYYTVGKPDGYTAMEKWPWTIAVFGERHATKDRPSLVRESLGRAVALYSAPDMPEPNQYAEGFKAYQLWTALLEDDARVGKLDKDQLSGACLANAYCYYCLMDARAAGAKYLRSIASQFKPEAAASLTRAAGLYEQIAQAIGKGREGLPTLVGLYPWKLDGGKAWTREMRHAEADILKDCVKLEQQALAELSHAVRIEGIPEPQLRGDTKPYGVEIGGPPASQPSAQPATGQAEASR